MAEAIRDDVFTRGPHTHHLTIAGRRTHRHAWRRIAWSRCLHVHLPHSPQTSIVVSAAAGANEKCVCEQPQQLDPRVAARTAGANSTGISWSSPARDQNRGMAEQITLFSLPGCSTSRNPFTPRNKTMFSSGGRLPFSDFSGSCLVMISWHVRPERNSSIRTRTGATTSMNAVDSEGIDRMEIRQWLASRPTESNVSAKLPHRAARFDSSHYVSSRQMLVLKTYLGVRKNSHLVQAVQHSPRQGEPAMFEQLLFLHHGLSLTRSVEQV